MDKLIHDLEMLADMLDARDGYAVDFIIDGQIASVMQQLGSLAGTRLVNKVLDAHGLAVYQWNNPVTSASQ